MARSAAELERLEQAQLEATCAARRAASAAPELAEWIMAQDRALAAVVRVLWVRSRAQPRKGKGAKNLGTVPGPLADRK